ncbi:hypothetical protein [Geminocystis herdmanii]|uniref:hypothetical protein n=1 Tax=Geminocystis herdmanii TaxID=669359 RepID=UPI0003468B3D|nr:hypothetical protein [Geminocystis herdmanii]
MNHILTGNRKEIFLIIAEYPHISIGDLCKFSILRDGGLYRINHHLMGLESEKFIEISGIAKRGGYKFKISSGKGERMLKKLKKTRKNERK